MSVAIPAKKVNKCVLAGMVAEPPKPFRTTTTKAFGLNFILAVEGEGRRDMVPFSVYGNLAIELSRKLKQGSSVLVEASVRTDTSRSHGKDSIPRLYLLLEKIVPIKTT